MTNDVSIDMYKEKIPLTVVLIALRDGNKVLLAKRKRNPYKGHWGVLGGRQVFGKQIQNIVKKEVLEETGYICNNIHIKGLYSEIFLDKNENVKDHFVFILTQAELDKNHTRNNNVENTDIEKFKWFEFPLKKKNIIPTDMIMLEDIESGKLHFRELILQEDEEKLKLLKVR